MEITYFEHARDRMRERHISEADIEAVIGYPDSTGPANKPGRTKYTKILPGSNKPIRVIAAPKRYTADHFNVYTVF